MTNPRKIEILLEEKEIRKILQKQIKPIFGTKGKILETKVKPVKIYRDRRSFNLAAFYNIKISGSGGKTRRKTVFAAADSRGGKEKDYLTGRRISDYLSENPGRILEMPRPYVFLKSCGLFLREHAEGTILAEAIRKNKGLTPRLARMIIEALREFQNIQIPPAKLKEAEKLPNFRDIEKNVKILRARRHPRISTVQKEFQKIKAGLAKNAGFENRQPKVLSHGDLNPFNIVLTPRGKIVFLDAGNAGRRHWLMDVAGFYSHLGTLKDLKIKKSSRTRSRRLFLNAYIKANGRKSLTEKEKALFALYERYFNLLALTHVLVWG